jgi:glycosyltransferase involved in cell wall biosynthesis
MPAGGKLSVAFLLPSFLPGPIGGSERQAYRLASALNASGVSVRILTRWKRGLPKSETFENVPVVRCASAFDGLYAVLSLYKKFESRIRRLFPEPPRPEGTGTESFGTILGRYDLFYGSVFFLNWWLYLRKHRKEIDVIHVHTIEWVALAAALLGRIHGKPVVIKDSTMNGLEKMRFMPFGPQLQRYVIENGNFVAMTMAIETAFRKQGVDGSRLVRIPNGLVVPSVPARKAALGRTAVFVGNLYQQPAKGVDVLFRAWVAVQSEFPDARLDVVGDGATQEYHDELARLGISGSVRLLGKRSDVACFLEEGDVFVLPSRREGMSNALMEAMAYGMPCVATDISGNQDLIEDGKNGLLVPAEDADSLARGIARMFRDPTEAKSLGARAREHLLEAYDMKSVSGRYSRYYESLLSARL